MEKKEVFDRLSQVYLSTPTKKDNNTREYVNTFIKGLTTAGIIIVVLGGSVFLFAHKIKNLSLKSEIAVVLSPDIIKIKLHFPPAKKEVYSLDLNRLNLKKFKALGFSLRKANYQDAISLKVEFANISKEKSEIYLREIPAYRWQDYRIGLAEFKGISSWSEMSGLSFIVEEWNSSEKQGAVYIDNLRFLG